MIPVAVAPHEVDRWAEDIQWHLEQFCVSGRHTPEDLLDEVRRTERQMWLVWDEGVKCVLLTCVSTDRNKTCIITHGAGEDFRAWLHLWDVIEVWARDLGCRRIEAIARPGWERPLKRFGMEKTHVVLEKRLQ